MNICVLEHPRVRSKEKFNDIANTPLWSCLMGGYAAAALRQADHDVCLVDATRWDFDRTKREILLLAPDLLCVNAVYFWEHTKSLFDLLSDLKTEGLKGHLTLFGFFPTLAFEAVLSNFMSVDSVVVGECEETLRDLADQLSKNEALEAIPGLALRANDGIRLAHYRQPEKDPDRFPFPERSGRVQDQTASVLASRGCYNHCVFCLVPSFYNHGPLWRGRSPENVYREMAELTDRGCRDFYFADPNFIGPGDRGQKRLRKMMDLIRPLNITFGMETRPSDLDPQALEALVSAGFKSLLLGIESGSSSVLGDLNKAGSISVGGQAIRMCRDAGIEPEIGFLMFVPDSTLADLDFNLEFLERNHLLDRLERTANLLGHRQIVMMGTSGYRRYERQGRLKRTGLLGFEGDVLYRDERVKWMSDLIVHACLFVLESMEDSGSALFWRGCLKEGNPQSVRLNNTLVELFKRLLAAAKKGGALTPVSEMKREIEREISQYP